MTPFSSAQRYEVGARLRAVILKQFKYDPSNELSVDTHIHEDIGCLKFSHQLLIVQVASSLILSDVPQDLISILRTHFLLLSQKPLHLCMCQNWLN